MGQGLCTDAPPETAHDLRRLYRDSEARAARLRLLVEAGKRLAGAQGAEVETAAAAAAQSAALLLGFARGTILVGDAARLEADELRIALVPPGSADRAVGALVLHNRIGAPPTSEAEDRAAVDVLVQLIAGALASRRREERLASLLAQLFGAQEAERAHVARELHDGVAQVATAALRRAELAEASGAPADMARAVELMRTTVGEIRRVIAGMRPTSLDDLGLAVAIERLACDLTEQGFDVRLSLHPTTAVPPVIETGLFRVAQEALNNVRAHTGGPCRVDLSLAADEGGLTLGIRDWGRGFDPERAPPADGREHLGLAFMRERIVALGGTLQVQASPSAGVHVLAKVPVA